MTTINWELINTEIREAAIQEYQANSAATIFPHEDIPDGIAAEEYAIKYMKESAAAAWHGMGFNPNAITLDFHGFSLKQTTIDQHIVLSESDLAFFQLHGMWKTGQETIGKNCAKTFNYSALVGRDPNATAVRHPLGQYNYLNEDGSGNGTAARPNPMYDANKSAAWTTAAIENADLSALISGMVAKGATRENIVVAYPKCADEMLHRQLASADLTGEEYLLQKERVRSVLPWEDEYMWTQAGAVPAITAWDLWAFDPSKFVVLDGRRETFKAGEYVWPMRGGETQGEWWGIFLPIPLRKDESGTIKTYKYFGRIKAIAKA